MYTYKGQILSSICAAEWGLSFAESFKTWSCVTLIDCGLEVVRLSRHWVRKDMWWCYQHAGNRALHSPENWNRAAGELLSHPWDVNSSYPLPLSRAASAALTQLAGAIPPMPVRTLFGHIGCYLLPIHFFLSYSTSASHILSLFSFALSGFFWP